MSRPARDGSQEAKPPYLPDSIKAIASSKPSRSRLRHWEADRSASRTIASGYQRIGRHQPTMSVSWSSIERISLCRSCEARPYRIEAVQSSSAISRSRSTAARRSGVSSGSSRSLFVVVFIVVVFMDMRCVRLPSAP